MSFVLFKAKIMNLFSIIKKSSYYSISSNELNSVDHESPSVCVDNAIPLLGWLMIEVDFLSTEITHNFFVHFETGRTNSSKINYIPYKSNGSSKRIFFTASAIKVIRFDGLETNLNKMIKGFRVVRLLPSFAIDRVVARIINSDFNYRGFNKVQLKKSIKKDARHRSMSWRRLLLHKYDQTFFKVRTGGQYTQWIENNEISYSELVHSNSIKCIDDFYYKPKVSIILTTYNSDIGFLQECLESIMNQSYSNWELCIVDDGSKSKLLIDLLKDLLKKDHRIRLELNNSNRGIAVSANQAIDMASGEFIGFVDHDDLLAKDCLAFCVNAINEKQDVSLVYTDEDKIDDTGCRFDPHFKPDWNYDLLLSQNYISHFTVIRSDIIEQVGGLRHNVEGAQDYDLLLRIIAQFNDYIVSHVPRVLYHWRAIPGSTAMSPHEKDYTSRSGLVALVDYHCSVCDKVEKVSQATLPNTYRHYWPILGEPPLVSLLIPSRDNFLFLKRCIDSILEKTDYQPYEIIVINNASVCKKTLGYLDSISKNSKIKVLNWNKPFNYSAINNFAALHSAGSVLGLINDDTEVINRSWLREMVSQVERVDVGCVGAKLYYPNDTIQHAGVILGIGGVAGHGHKYFSRNDHGYFSRLRLVHNVSAVTGACLLVKKEVYFQVKGLEEEYLPVAFNDVDFCLKVGELGRRNIWTPFAELYHHESISRGSDNSMTKKIRARKEVDYMREKWGSLLDADPLYNPNLTLVFEDFSIS